MAKRAQLDEVRPLLNEVNAGASKVEGVLDAVEAGADKATDILEGGLEKVADVVPEALDKSVHVVAEGTRKGIRFFQSPKKLAIAIVVTSTLAGAGLGVAGYFLLKKKLELKLRKEMEAELEMQIEGMRVFYQARSVKKQSFDSPEEAAQALLEPNLPEEKAAIAAAEALNEYEGPQPPGIVEDPSGDPRENVSHRVRYDKVPSKRGPNVPVSTEQADKNEPVELTEVPRSRNVFDAQSIEGWDQEREEASRVAEHPYIISHDEHLENAFEHGQNTLTYYAGDQILVDERQQPIEDVEAVVGIENLRFGHGSRDASIVYIRNERIELDLEVVRDSGTYVEEVLGHEPPTPRLRHGRRGDDG